MRDAEREVGRAYGRWGVSAHASNLGSPLQGGVRLRERLEARGFAYVDGTLPHDPTQRAMFECYPYTTIVGMDELGFDERRPPYKRLDRSVSAAEARVIRAAAGDDLIRRVADLRTAEPPLDLRSHPVTRALVDEDSPLEDAAYKHREDLLDAVIAAWTAAIWHRLGAVRVQVLGRHSAPDAAGRIGTIVAPARAMQRLELAAAPASVPDATPVGVARPADAALDLQIRELSVLLRAEDPDELDDTRRRELGFLATEIVRLLSAPR
jgi:predicted RNase H-like nuclease